MVFNCLQEVNSIDHLAIGDQQNLITEARWQSLDQLLVLVLCYEGHHVGLNILLDLLGGIKGNLSLSGKLRQALDSELDRFLDMTTASEKRREVANNERIKDNTNQHPNEGKNDLSVREGRNIAIPYRSDRLSGPMQRPDVVNS